jgi:two-component system, OmpR family, sensor histidine kinase BaeS
MISSSIKFKLIGSFIAVVMIFGFLIIVSVRFAAERNYRQHINRSDMTRAEELADILGSYYQRYGSWNQVQEALGIIPVLAGSNQRMNPSKRPQFGSETLKIIPRRERGSTIMPGIIPRIVLTDVSGKVIFDSAGLVTSENFSQERLKKAEPVRADNTVAGFLFLGSMLESKLDFLQRDFIRNLTNWLILLTIIIAAAAVLTGSFILKQIIDPLNNIGRAAELLTHGDLSARVTLHRKDEFGALASRFNTMAESLEASDKWRRQIIDDSAHELRTPVSLIQSRLELMLEGIYPIDRKQIKALSEETAQLNHLVEELKTLSEAETADVLLEKEEINPNDLCRKIAETFSADADQKKIEIELSLLNKKTLPIDRKKIYQVLANLLKNALRYCPEDGKIRISTWSGGFSQLDTASGHEGTSPESESSFIAVEDSGPGIPEAERAIVFERYYRLDKARNREGGGRGLGLAIAAAVTKAHGGKIQVEESKLGGARFVVQLPNP